MEEQENRPSEEPLHRGQQLFDNVFLLLIASILVSGILYNVWGMLELFVFTK